MAVIPGQRPGSRNDVEEQVGGGDLRVGDVQNVELHGKQEDCSGNADRRGHDGDQQAGGESQQALLPAHRRASLGHVSRATCPEDRRLPRRLGAACEAVRLPRWWAGRRLRVRSYWGTFTAGLRPDLPGVPPDHGTELAAFLHRGQQATRAQQRLRDMIQDLLTEGAETGDLRDDVAPDELASYCLHALTAASSLSSKAAVRRLVTVTLAGLRPRSPQSPGGLCRAC
jgi:hypothetical protein